MTARGDLKGTKSILSEGDKRLQKRSIKLSNKSPIFLSCDKKASEIPSSLALSKYNFLKRKWLDLFKSVILYKQFMQMAHVR